MTPRSSGARTNRPSVPSPRRARVRRTARRSALALSLLLVLATLALPAVAEDDAHKTFTASFKDDGEFTAFDESGQGIFDVEFELENTSDGGDGLRLGSANVSVDSDDASDSVTLTGSDDGAVNGQLELRDLDLKPGDKETFEVTASATCGTSATFDVDAKQSNDFRGAGNDLVLQRAESTLEVAFECGLPAYLDGLERADCTEDEECEVADTGDNDHELSASSNGGSGQLFAGFRATEDDDNEVTEGIAEKFHGACQELVEDRRSSGHPSRLIGDIVQVEPVELAGDHVTIEIVVPRTVVMEDENRSAKDFDVCFMGDEKSFGDTGLADELKEADDQPFVDAVPADGVPALHGPVLLPDCSGTVDAPCVESRQKVRADVQLVIRIKASDPWMM